MSALAEFIRDRMNRLGKSQTQIAADAGIKESTLSNIMTSEKVIPRPKTIRGLAKAIDVDAPLLTSLLGYPIDLSNGSGDRFTELARQLRATPWVADRIPDLMKLRREEFDEVMRYIHYRLADQQSENPPTE